MTGGRLVFVALRVADLEAAARFYRESIGVPLRRSDGGPLEEAHHEYSWREGDYLHFALFQAAPGEETQRVQVGFFVDDLDTAHDRAVATGAAVLHPPRDEPWGRTARYADPDGNVVGLTESAH